MPNHSIEQWLQDKAAGHTPEHRCVATDPEQWSAWREALLSDLLPTLGWTPKPVPLEPEVIAEWRADGLVKQRIQVRVEANLFATVYIFRPESATGKLPAILCCHGHGPFGKEPMMGNRSSSELEENIRLHNYDFGLRMAQSGFVTAAIDWRGFGDRDDRGKPVHRDLARGRRDLCNVNYLRVAILGQSLLGLNVFDGQRVLDLLCQQPFVDPDRLGVMGLSLGGTIATWLAICDDRVKAADIIGYSDRFADFGMRDANFCGSQITPGLFRLCDVPDLQGLIAPRPLLVEIGLHDTCFRIESAMSCFHEVERIYTAAQAREALELDLFQGGHAWGGNKSENFFRKAL